MKGILFLSGGGTEKESYSLDKEFSKVLKNRLLYIPIAIDPKKHPYIECLKWIKSVFQQFGFHNIEMWTDLRNKSLEELKNFDAVYIGGGNTFKLLKALKDTNFDELLIKFCNYGGHIYGGSAGAIILGENIITASKDDINEVGLKDLSGLNLCEGYSILCHYTAKDKKFIDGLMEKYKIKIIALQENSGLIIKNGNFIPVGDGEVWMFENGSKRKL